MRASPPLPFIPGSDAGGEIEAVGANVKNVGRRRSRLHPRHGRGAHRRPLRRRVCRARSVPARPRLQMPDSDLVRAGRGDGRAVRHCVSCDCFTAPARGPARSCSSTARPAASASRPCRSPARTASPCSARAAPIADWRRCATAAPISCSTTPRRTISTTIMRATGGRGVDVILEMAAHVNLDKDLGLLAPRGRVVVIGNRGRVEIDRAAGDGPRRVDSRDDAVQHQRSRHGVDQRLYGRRSRQRHAAGRWSAASFRSPKPRKRRTQ